MTGLNLETFLRILQADLWVWVSLAIVVSVLGMMAWASLGSRRVLRKCLVVSVLAHLGAIAFGGHTTWGIRAFGPAGLEAVRHPDRIHQIRVLPKVEGASSNAGEDTASTSKDGVRSGRRPLAAWDRPGRPLLAQAPARARPPATSADPVRREEQPMAPVVPDAAAPAIETPEAAPPEKRSEPDETAQNDPAPAPDNPANLVELPKVEPLPRGDAIPDLVGPLRTTDRRRVSDAPTQPRTSAPSEPFRPEVAAAPTSLEKAESRPPPQPDLAGPLAAADPNPLGPELAVGVARSASAAPVPSLAMPGAGIRLRPSAGGFDLEAARSGRPQADSGSQLIARATPSGVLGGALSPRPALAPRALPEVPEVYRPRLDPNRSQRAQRAGASVASEEAVERALVWLARHQDADGRWNAATERDANGNPLADASDFTVHCPPGDICAGECYYWEADTALTGLALLSYLGAGYTHRDNKAHAATVARGLDYLLSVQKPNGDLRGRSQAIGMYCHSMATLALCEAYALTGDERLKMPIERAVRFLVRAKATDGLGWRYLPGEPIGDTSILGWVILVLKSARERHRGQRHDSGRAEDLAAQGRRR